MFAPYGCCVPTRSGGMARLCRESMMCGTGPTQFLRKEGVGLLEFIFRVLIDACR